MAYSLRLPAALDAAARERSDYLGISLNALLCVALDAYLRTPEQPNDDSPTVPQVAPAPTPTPAPRVPMQGTPAAWAGGKKRKGRR